MTLQSSENQEVVLPPGRIKHTDIPQFPRSTYEVSVRIKNIEDHIQFHTESMGLNIDPEFQRGHVWSLAQRSAYLEYLLQGGEVAQTLICSCRKWRECVNEDYVIVDGKQRLEAVRSFSVTKFQFSVSTTETLSS